MDKIVGVELSHRFAPISVRERMALNKEQTRSAINALKEFYTEVFIVSTCNRLSIYAFGKSHNELINYFDQFGNYRQFLSILPDSEISIRNLFSTAAGLESQAVGEHQIIGQIRDALEIAREEKSIGPVLDQLIRQSVHAGKKVRLETNIGKFSASLATVGFELIHKHGFELSETTFLIIGTGNMANLVTTVLDRSKIKKLYVASHDDERAEEMAKEWGGEPVNMQNMHDALSKANVVVGGTQGEINLLHEETMAESKCPRAKFALESGGNKLFIDFGVPRNFNPDLKNHDNIWLYDLDDIKKITYDGLLKRYDEIPKARQLVNEEVDAFLVWLKNRKVAPVIEAYWNNLEDIKEEELNWLLPKMGDLDEKQIDLLKRFTHRMIRKVSNPAIEGIKNIAQNLSQQSSPLNTAKQLLDVEEVDVFVPKKKIVVGTRGSKLALTQTNWIVDQLKKVRPEFEFETKIIRTSGDDGDISVVGAFTSALQRSILAEEVDIAVHSYKDVPTEEVNGLRVLTVTPRKDVRDVLVSKGDLKLKDLPAGAIVGTGSLRRSAQLKQIRPDLEYKFIQGNVDSRILQMENGDFDAIVLAATGLQKMNMESVVTEYFDLETMLPAVGQAILGVELIDKEGEVLDMVKELVDYDTRYAASAERAYLLALGGGCNMPIAAYAKVTEGVLNMSGFYATEDGSVAAKGETSGKIEDRKSIARDLALKLKQEVETKKEKVIVE